MSGLKNSPFGKRLRAAQQDNDEDGGHRRNRPKIIPLFGGSTPSLDSSLSTTSDSTPDESPPRPRRDSLREREKEYGDRFVPNRDAGDMRTSYHLKDEGGPSTPSKNRIIPTESDALKGMTPVFIRQWLTNRAQQNKQTLYSHLSCIQRSPLPHPSGRCHQYAHPQLQQYQPPRRVNVYLPTRPHPDQTPPLPHGDSTTPQTMPTP